ncbi:MAG: hypothetical protein P1U42_05285 [Phycisphaerales bacterium]|nr:hypothetical protein [Phycisphaerales bacterium]
MIGCLLAAGTLIMPRILLFVFWITGLFGKVDPWETKLWPILGFLFLPATTLVFGLCHLYGEGEFNILWIVLMVLAVMYDLGSSGSAGTHKKRRNR